MPRRNHKSGRVLLVDDQLLIREGVKLLLQGLPQIKVVGESSGCSEALEFVARESPDIIIVSLQVENGGALEFLEQLSQAIVSPEGRALQQSTPGGMAPGTANCKVIVLTWPIPVEECRRAIVLGAKAVVLKKRPASSLFTAIERVSKGEVWIDPDVMTQILTSATSEHDAQRNPEKESIASLTEREIEVIELLAEGLTNNEIAERMFVSEGTVRHYLNRVFTKLHITDRSKLLIYAFRHGIAKPF